MKKRNLLFGLLWLLVMNFVIYSQETKSETIPIKSGEYEKLIAQLKSGDTNIDYKALRFAYTKTKDYSPYGCPDGRIEVVKTFNAKKFQESIDLAEKFMETCYIEIDVHYVSAVAYRQLKQDKKADFHQDVYLGLVKSLTEDKDGKSAKNAWIVISIREEYAILSNINFDWNSQALVEEDGSRFDVIEAVNEEDKKQVEKFYFNVDILFDYYAKQKAGKEK